MLNHPEIKDKIFTGYSEDIVEINPGDNARVRIYNIYFIQDDALTGWCLNSHAASDHHFLPPGRSTSILKSAEEELLISIAGDIYSRCNDREYAEFGNLFPLLDLEYWQEFLKLKKAHDGCMLRQNLLKSRFMKISDNLPAFSSKGISVSSEMIFYDKEIFRNPGHHNE
jgi:hypothetical protein